MRRSSMAHNLNRAVVAEGVEIEEHLDFLREQGCEVLQGYPVLPAAAGGQFREPAGRARAACSAVRPIRPRCTLDRALHKPHLSCRIGDADGKLRLSKLFRPDAVLSCMPDRLAARENGPDGRKRRGSGAGRACAERRQARVRPVGQEVPAQAGQRHFPLYQRLERVPGRRAGSVHPRVPRDRRRFAATAQFYTWIYKIAINTAKNYLVSQGRRPPTDDIARRGRGAVRRARRACTIRRHPNANSCARKLNEPCSPRSNNCLRSSSVAITLREVDGLSYEEIAEAMNCPIGTVRSRIFRAREAIDEKLRPLLSEK